MLFRAPSVRIVLAAAAFTVALAGSALAVMQPDGTVVPVIRGPTSACTSGLNVQACVDDAERTLGGTAGTVNAITNARIDNETFDTSCQLTFKVLSRGGSFYSHAFGWYIPKAGNTPPALSELNVFLTCADAAAPGTIKTLTVPAGVTRIAFFMASYVGPCGPVAANGTLAQEPGYTFYTEQRLNGRNRAGATIPGIDLNVIRVLTWQSAAEPGTFYFGWEDDGTSTDNNFNDLVTQVGGISCTGAGKRCETGMQGMCAKGTLQCRGGLLACLPDQPASAEKCNALDDNCDGAVDEGNMLCPPSQVCFRGTCVPNCASGEFPCGALVCEVPPGVCIERECKGVVCPAGQVCRGGKCLAECEGVRCPYGQACRRGGCVDVCAGLTCDAGTRCVVQYPDGMNADPVGVCTTCPCKGCGGGMMCVSNACLPDDCANVTCAPGTHCQGGRCADNCAGAACPSGTKCQAGNCIPDGTNPGGTGGGTAPPGTGGMAPPGTGGGGGPASGGTDAGSDGRAGAGQRFGPDCACNVPTGGPATIALLLSAALAIAFARRRRRG